MIDFLVNNIFLVVSIVLLAVLVFLVAQLRKYRDFKKTIESGLSDLSNNKIASEKELNKELQPFYVYLKDRIGVIENFANGDLTFDRKENGVLEDSLESLKNKIDERNQKDSQEKWLQVGLTQFGSLLRSEDNMDKLMSKLISEVVRYVGVNQGAFFLLENKPEAEGQHLVMNGCYAYGREKHHKQTIELGAGIIGAVFLEQEYICIDEIPEDYVRITSGLGAATPNHLLVAPLIYSGECTGVIELLSFEEIGEHQIDFINKLSEMIASTVAIVRINNKTKELLEDSNRNAELLKDQESEMKNVIEELNKSKDEMAEQQNELLVMKEQAEEQGKIVANTNQRYKLIFDSVNEGLWELLIEEGKDVEEFKFWGSEKLAQILGLDLASEEFTTKDVFSKIDPRFRQYIFDSVVNVYKGKSDHFTIDFTLINEADTEWFRFSCKNLKDDKGAVTRVAGAISSLKDLTRKNELEKALDRADDIYFNNGKTISLKVNHAGEISAANRYGMSLFSDFIGRNVKDVFDIDIVKENGFLMPVKEGTLIGDNVSFAQNDLGICFRFNYRDFDSELFLLDLDVESFNNQADIYVQVMEHILADFGVLQSEIDKYLLELTTKIFDLKNQVESVLKENADLAISTKDSLKTVVDDFGAIIISLQYHDAVTQKLQHCRANFEEYKEIVKSSANDFEKGVIRLFPTICNNNEMQLKLIRMELINAIDVSYKSLNKVWNNEEASNVINIAFFDIHEAVESIDSKIGNIIGEISFLKYHFPVIDYSLNDFKEEIIGYRKLFTMESERQIFDKVFSDIEFTEESNEDLGEMDDDGLELF